MKVKISVVSIGDELLRGQTTNTNLSFLGKILYQEGWQIESEQCVADQMETLLPTLQQSIENHHVTITIGGLGATSDDISKTCVAQCLQRECYVDEDECEAIKQKLMKRNYSATTDFVRTQATLIQGCQTLVNDNGLASGIWLEVGEKIVIMLPGPPAEFCRMTEEQVVPKLKAIFEPQIVCHVMNLVGISESEVAIQTEEILKEFSNVRASYCAAPRQVRLTLNSNKQFDAELQSAVIKCQSIFGFYSLPNGCENLVQGIAFYLKSLKLTMATAESCTGGLIAKYLTDESGSSSWFYGSYVTYDNSWKQRCLGVESSCLEKFGAVSEETASAMIQGLLKQGEVQAGIAVTGIAGPGGGTEQKPVGTVYIATGVLGDFIVNRYNFRGNREHIRYLTAMNALLQLYQQLCQSISLH